MANTIDYRTVHNNGIEYFKIVPEETTEEGNPHETMNNQEIIRRLRMITSVCPSGIAEMIFDLIEDIKKSKNT
jgi:hypothetical protein